MVVTVLTYQKRGRLSGLIDIQNIDDNERLKWCLVRQLHPVDHNTARIRRVDKKFTKQLDF